MIYKCIYYVKLYKHKNFGRVGAINLEQLETLLSSLKTYWDNSNNKALFTELRTIYDRPAQSAKELNYEL